MIIKTVTENTEQKFLNELNKADSENLNYNILCCNFTKVHSKPNPEKILTLLKDLLYDKEASLFFFSDGDVFIKWKGPAKKTTANIKKALSNVLTKRFKPVNVVGMFDHHDTGIHSDNEKLRELCEIKAKETERKIKLSAKPLEFTDMQLLLLEESIEKRKNREAHDIEILIVEDMPLSMKLLKYALSKEHKCHTAKDALPALDMYAFNAPDICFLDVELPNGNGHNLAEVIKKSDPDCYIIMVTANNYKRDVTRAHANKVKNFIVKPFNLKRIYKCVDDYFIHRRKRENNV